MSEAWKNLDLEGAGLQAANVKLAKLLKRRSTAYWLLAAFPLGLHRAYLDSPAGAWAYRAASIVLLVALWLNAIYLAAAIAIIMLGFALYDIRWIDNRVAAINKKARTQVLMTTATPPPVGYKGRYTDESPNGPDNLEEYVKLKEQERGGHTPFDKTAPQSKPKRAPSFAEQEAMLREMFKSKKKE